MNLPIWPRGCRRCGREPRELSELEWDYRALCTAGDANQVPLQTLAALSALPSHLRGDGGAEVDAPVITPRLIGALGGALGHLARAWPAATTRLAWSASPTSSPLWVSSHPTPTLILSAPVWAARQREWARQWRSARSQAQAAPPAESVLATCQTHEATKPKAGDPAASSACNDNERGTP